MDFLFDKKIFLSLLIIIAFRVSSAQQITYFVKEQILVSKGFFGNNYKSIKNIGNEDLNSLRVELLSSYLKNDSVFIEAIVKACPYYISPDRTDTTCQVNKKFFTMQFAEVVKEQNLRIGSKYQRGVFKAKQEIFIEDAVNRRITLKLKRKNEYTLLFRYRNYTSVILRLHIG